jgi:DNA-binding transcriptional MerR regulator
LRGIRHLLHAEGYTIKGVQKILREQGIDYVKNHGRMAAAASQRGAQGKRARQAAGRQGPPVGEQPPRRRSAVDEKIRVPQGRGLPQGVLGAEERALLTAAIRELETCRKMLLETTDKHQASRGSRRARAVSA